MHHGGFPPFSSMHTIAVCILSVTVLASNDSAITLYTQRLYHQYKLRILLRIWYPYFKIPLNFWMPKLASNDPKFRPNGPRPGHRSANLSLTIYIDNRNILSASTGFAILVDIETPRRIIGKQNTLGLHLNFLGFTPCYVNSHPKLKIACIYCLSQM